MSAVNGIITSGTLTGETVIVELPTVRTPELDTASLTVLDTDLIDIHQVTANKRCKITLAALRTYIQVGTPGDPQPVVYGADVEIKITSAQNNLSTVNVPVLAGEMFSLEQRGVGKLLSTEYYILPGGGFSLRPKDINGNVVDDNDPNGTPQVVHTGEVYIAHVFSFAEITNPNPVAGGDRFDGVELATSNITIAPANRKKLIHCEFGNAKGQVTLEDIQTAPENLEVVIETMLNCNFQTKVVAKAGQKIYCLNEARDYIYLGRCEVLSLLRYADGWYVTSPVQYLLNIGDIAYGYKQGLNQLKCEGQVLQRNEYTRLFDWVQTLGQSVVSETTWGQSVTIPDKLAGTRQIYYPYKACFTLGNGANNFRLPDLRGMYMRGLGGDSPVGRVHNYPGGIAPDTYLKHDHEIGYTNGSEGDSSSTGVPLSDFGPTGSTKFKTTAEGGFETSVINAGMFALINV